MSTAAPPPPNKVTPDVAGGWRVLMPPILITWKMAEKEAEDIRADFMRNQKLPQLDLKATYGMNGLGTNLSNPRMTSPPRIFRHGVSASNLRCPWQPGGEKRYAAALARKER